MLGKNKSDGNIKTGAECEPGAVPTKSDWFRIMILYDSNRYFVSGQGCCNDGEHYLGQRVKATYGIDTNKDSFVTVSGLNTPYIKFHRTDADNTGDYHYFLRFSKDDKLSDSYWNMCADWYLMACACDFTLPDRNIKDYKEDDDYYPSPIFKWDGGQVRLFYNVPGVADRGWHDCGGGEIDASKKWEDTSFSIYMGEKCTISVAQTSTEIEPGEPVCWNNYVIAEGVVITVPEGATLVVDGVCYNNGMIYLEGGTLIVRGVLDVDVNAVTTGSIVPGSMQILRGHLIVEDSGAFLIRKSDARFFTFMSSIDVDGVMVLACSPYISTISTVRGGYGSMIALGVAPVDTVSQGSYNAKWLKDNNGNYLSSICTSTNSSMTVCGNSSVICDGIFFSSSNIEVCDYSHVRAYRSYNINASIYSMMRHW